MTVYDISQTLRPGLPVWPGDTAFELHRTWSLGSECPVNVSRLTLSTHSGSHADAPLHYDANGQGSADCDFDAYLGPALLIDMSTNVSNWLGAEQVADRLPDRLERVLFRLMRSFPHDDWPSDFPAVSAATIDLLAARGCRLIGVDTPSLDPQASKTMDAHHAVRRAGMAILEGLVLDRVSPGEYELIALPLKIAGADASPVRAILRDLPR